MNNKELIKKAYDHFKGVWPFNEFDNIIVSRGSNYAWGGGTLPAFWKR